MEESRKEEATKKNELSSQIDGVEMLLINDEGKAYYDESVRINTDGYGGRCVSYANEWAHLMQSQISPTDNIQDNHMKRERKIKRSNWFWFVTVLVTLIVTGFISLNALGLELGAGSIMVIDWAVDNIGDDGETPLWIYLMPLTWGCFLIGGIGWCLMTTYEHTIGAFINWLDRDRSYKQNQQ